MSKGKQRVQIDLDPNVTRALTSPPAGSGKVGKHDLVRINVRIPADLKQQIRSEFLTRLGIDAQVVYVAPRPPGRAP